ncbi:MAG TPA: hypothetical protein VKT19_06265 [Steroidobacteraceae bacterium]|nr:hypothetical protein [Steroidobacteraceae bacterium]
MKRDLNGRLEAAALSLTGQGPIKERLSTAYCAHLQDIPAADLPALGDEFEQMIQALHRAEALPGDDVVRASVRKLSNKEACYYAELVVRLYGTLAGLKHQLVSARGTRVLAATGT